MHGEQFFKQRQVTGRWPERRVIMSCDASRGPLLTRYFLLRTRRLGIYLHHLQASDHDRALHDHPWPFISILLSGGYYEHTPSVDALGSERRWKRWGSILYRPALWRHRLELTRPTWTLVIRFQREREWGFYTPHGWQSWSEYGKEWCD